MESDSDSESDVEELARLSEAVGGVPQENRENQGIESIFVVKPCFQRI